MIDKCPGDQIMAYWGVLDERPDHALQAAAAGLEMQIAMFEFNRNERVREELELPPEPLAQGVGINSGEVCAGNIGGDQKIEFTIIGNAVNIAARIESAAGRTQVYVGPETYERIRTHALCFRLPPIRARNVAEPLTLYSVRGLIPPPDSDAASSGTAIPPPEPGKAGVGHLLLCLPCLLEHAGGSTPALLTGILRGDKQHAKLILVAEHALELGSAVTLKFQVAEKPGLPPITGQTERCSRFPQRNSPELPENPGLSRSQAAVIAVTQPGVGATAKALPPGAIVIDVPALPATYLSWKPGTLEASDFTDAEQLQRS